MKSIEDLLRIEDLELLKNLREVEKNNIFVSTCMKEKVEKCIGELKSRKFKDIIEFELFFSKFMNSTKENLSDRLYENITAYLIFSLLLDKIHEEKQSQSRISSSFGSGLRFFGGKIRGFSGETFQRLYDAMANFEKKSGSTSSIVGNFFRGCGESFCGESTTLYRVIKRTVCGQNPFLKQLDTSKPTISEENIRDFDNGDKQFLVGISRSLLRVFHKAGREAAFHYIQYLYRYVFSYYGTTIDELKKKSGGLSSNPDENFFDKNELPSIYVRYWLTGIALFEMENHPQSDEMSSNVFIENCCKRQKIYEDMLYDGRKYIKNGRDLSNTTIFERVGVALKKLKIKIDGIVENKKEDKVEDDLEEKFDSFLKFVDDYDEDEGDEIASLEKQKMDSSDALVSDSILLDEEIPKVSFSFLNASGYDDEKIENNVEEGEKEDAQEEISLSPVFPSAEKILESIENWSDEIEKDEKLADLQD